MTGEQRWRDAWTESDNVVREPAGRTRLWTKHIGKAPKAPARRRPWRRLEPVRLLQGSPIEDARDVGQMLERNAIVEGPSPTGRRRRATPRAQGRIRVQRRRGAPGFIPAASYLTARISSLPARSSHGRRPTRAEPNVCHGRRGNGYALLKAFECTGDELWPHEPRSRCMCLSRSRCGRGCDSLFTGDVGARSGRADRLDAGGSRSSTAGLASRCSDPPRGLRALTEESWDAERAASSRNRGELRGRAPYRDLRADDSETSPTRTPVKDLYTGAGGVAFASTLVPAAAVDADVGIDLAGATLRALEPYQPAPDYVDYAAKPAVCRAAARARPGPRAWPRAPACSAAKPESSRWRFASHAS